MPRFRSNSSPALFYKVPFVKEIEGPDESDYELIKSGSGSEADLDSDVSPNFSYLSLTQIWQRVSVKSVDDEVKQEPAKRLKTSK